MSHRRTQQLHRAGERALQGRPVRAARSVTAVPRPRRSPAAVSPATPRHAPAEPGNDPESQAAQPQRLDWARRIELIAVLVAAVVSVVGLLYSNSQVRDQLKVSRQELGVTQEGQITDRYTAAVENLGDDAMDVRLGGIYALQRIMEDSPRDHPTIANVLTTYIRTRTDKPRKKDAAVPADVHAALMVLVFRDSRLDDFFTLDLRGAHLSNVELRPRRPGKKLDPADRSGAFLHRQDRPRADLSGAYLAEADLSDADLSGAKLSNTDLRGADLSVANLRGVNLSRADLSGAKLRGAFLSHADLRDGDLSGTNLSGAFLSDADLRGADLRGADLRGAHRG
ncbi:pentapeptide repeat-containing protein [Streptomyces sp. NPDC047725]|uniref:pentapeptide repeat-containing protein n=1 Tax=Streptomyces sp. NPDC047725 TaxID=3365487 RepID=UPI00371A287A